MRRLSTAAALGALGLGLMASPALFADDDDADVTPTNPTGEQPAEEQPQPGEQQMKPVEPAPQQPAVAPTELAPPPAVEPLPEPRTERRRQWLKLEAGGGVNNFTGALDDATDVGTAWEARAVLMPQFPISAELAYVGSANAINHLDEDSSNNYVMTNGGEGALRLNLLTYRGRINPFVFGGVGYQRLSVDNDTVASNGLALEDDNIFTVPLGGGLDAEVIPHLSVGARITYRFMFQEDFGNINSDVNDEAGTDAITATARIGYQF